MDLSTRAAAVLAAKPCASLEQALPSILAPPPAATSLAAHANAMGEEGNREDGLGAHVPPRTYALSDLQAEAGFVCSQLRTFLKVGGQASFALRCVGCGSCGFLAAEVPAATGCGVLACRTEAGHGSLETRLWRACMQG